MTSATTTAPRWYRKTYLSKKCVTKTEVAKTTLTSSTTSTSNFLESEQKSISSRCRDAIHAIVTDLDEYADPAAPGDNPLSRASYKARCEKACSQILEAAITNDLAHGVPSSELATRREFRQSIVNKLLDENDLCLGACEKFEPGYMIVRRELRPTDFPGEDPEGFHYKTYGYFDNPASFCAWYRKLPEAHRMFHEVIMPERRTKAVFDLDAVQTKIDSCVARYSSPLSAAADPRLFIFGKLMDAIKYCFKECYDISLDPFQIVVCDSSNEKKFSRHILINGYAFMHLRERAWFCGRVFDHFMSCSPYMDREFVDLQPTKQARGTLRMTLSHKYGEPSRVKRIISVNGDGKKHSFFDSIVQAHDDETINLCRKTLICPRKPRSRPAPLWLVDLVQGEVEMQFPGMYELGSATGTQFHYNKAPGSYGKLCPICLVSHDYFGIQVSLHGNVAKASCLRARNHDATKYNKKELFTLNLYDWQIRAMTMIEYFESVGPYEEVTKLPGEPLEVNMKDLDKELFLTALRKADTMIVQSGLGTSKTKCAINAVKVENYKTVLILSCRVALADELEVRFAGFENYRRLPKNKPLSLIEHPHLITQLNSVHRVTPGPNGEAWPDLLIIDESEAVLGQFSHNVLIENDKLTSCWQSFEALVKYSKKVLLMDAFVGPRTCLLVEMLREKGKVSSIRNLHRAENRYYELMAKAVLENSIDDDIRAERKIFIVSNAKSFVDVMIARAKELKPHLTDRYVSYTSDPSSPIADLEDVLTSWGNKLIVGISPTVTTGVSYEGTDFQRVYGYFTSESCDYRDCMQMLGRVRECKDPATGRNTYRIAFADNLREHDAPETEEWQMKYLEDRVSNALTDAPRRLRKGALTWLQGNGSAKIDEHGHLVFERTSFLRMAIANAVEHIKSHNSFMESLLRLIYIQGGVVSSCNEKVSRQDAKDNKQVTKLAKEKMKKDRISKLLGAEIITNEQLDTLHTTCARLTETEQWQVKRAELARHYRIPSDVLNEELIDQLADEKTQAIFRRLNETTGEHGSISANARACIGKAAMKTLENMKLGKVSSQLIKHDPTSRHKATIALLKLAGFDMNHTSFFEIPAVWAESVYYALRKGLEAYFTKFRDILVHDMNKDFGRLQQSGTWSNKHIREFLSGTVEATYGFTIVTADEETEDTPKTPADPKLIEVSTKAKRVGAQIVELSIRTGRVTDPTAEDLILYEEEKAKPGFVPLEATDQAYNTALQKLREYEKDIDGIRKAAATHLEEMAKVPKSILYLENTTPFIWDAEIQAYSVPIPDQYRTIGEDDGD